MARRDSNARLPQAAALDVAARFAFWLPAALLLAALFLPSPARSAPTPVSRASERYTIPGPKIAIYNLAGACVLEPASGSETIVEVMRGGSDSERLKIATGVIDNRHALRVLYPERRVIYPPMGRGSNTSLRVHSDGTFGGHDSRLWPDGERVSISGSGGGFEGHADLRVRIPRGSDVLLRLAVGDVRVTNVDSKLFIDLSTGAVATSDTRGGLGIDTGSGLVHVARARGALSIDSGSGGVTVKDVAGGPISIDTGSGDVDASNLETPTLAVDTGSGSVDLAEVNSKSVHVDTGSGSVSVQLQSLIDELNIDTGSGGVEVALPKETGAMVALQTGSGGLDVDLPVKNLRRDHGELHAQLGDGAGRIMIETGSGGIRIAGH